MDECKESKKYDKEFLTIKQTEVNKFKEIIQDPQFEMDIMTTFNKIKVETINFANVNNNPNIYAVNSIQSHIFSCSDSTINSEDKSATPSQIPTTVSIQKDNLHNQKVTSRKHKKNISIVNTEQIIKNYRIQH